MIINEQDIAYYETETELGANIYKNKVKLHKPSGVIFQCTMLKKENSFAFFVVGGLNEDANLEDRKSFDGKNDVSFFEAVAYFERLIESRLPEPKYQPPSVGKFIFRKGMDSLIILPDSTEVIVKREDIEKVFTPPKTKPYGRLNMLAVEKPEYDIVASKFALNYNEKETNSYCDANNMTANDCAVYEMTPYSNGTDDAPQKPQDVNDESLSLNDIEDENQDDLKGEDKQQSDDKKDSENESEESKQGEESEESEQSKENKTKESKESKEGKKGQEDKEKDEQSQKGEESEEQGEESESEQESESKGQSVGEANEKEQKLEINREDNKILQQVVEASSTNETVNVLNKLFKFDISNFKTTKRTIVTLNTFSENQLKMYYNDLKIPQSTTKEQFLNIIEQRINPYFN